MSRSHGRSSEEAAAVDAAEDELYGEKRGDELPEQLTSEHGRRAWFREAKRRLDEQRAKEAKPIPQSRPKRLKESKRRLEEELWTEQRANAAYEAWRARGVMANGRKLHTPAKPYVPPETPAGKVNVTDPDSRNVKTPRGYMQGYNAQAVVGENQIVIAAEVNADSPRLRAPGADGHRRRAQSSRRPVLARPPRSSSPIPAIGISRWRTSSRAGSK